jgi:hypothetical protein
MLRPIRPLPKVLIYKRLLKKVLYIKLKKKKKKKKKVQKKVKDLKKNKMRGHLTCYEGFRKIKRKKKIV